VRPLRSFVLGVWDFIVGDDWRTAIGVVIGLALTALIADANLSAWWVMPIAVLGLLAISIRRALRADGRRLRATHRDGADRAQKGTATLRP
jgi:hypothetical protein